MNLDLKTQQLYQEVLTHAERIRIANPCLFGDIENIIPYNRFGPRIEEKETRDKFFDLFIRLLDTSEAFLIEMRDAAWEVRKTTTNPNTHDLRESAPYHFINGTLTYKRRPVDYKPAS